MFRLSPTTIPHTAAAPRRSNAVHHSVVSTISGYTRGALTAPGRGR
jgi:hypothetical protein